MTKDILASGLIIVAIVTGYFFVYPAWQEMSEVRQKRAAYEEAIAQVRKFEKQREELLRQVNSFSSRDLRRVLAIMPDERNPLQLLLAADKILDDLGIPADNLSLDGAATQRVANGTSASFQGGETSVPYETTAISFSFQGSYQRMKRIITELEYRMPLFDVTGLAFGISGDGTQNTYAVTMHTYSLRAPQQEE